jgi:hypothetical protein
MYFFMVVTKGKVSTFPFVFKNIHSIYWIIKPQIPSDRRQIYNYVQHHMMQES